MQNAELFIVSEQKQGGIITDKEEMDKWIKMVEGFKVGLDAVLSGAITEFGDMKLSDLRLLINKDWDETVNEMKKLIE